MQLLALLSQPLAEDIKHESFYPHLVVHPLFDSIGRLAQNFTSSLQALSFAKKDMCFKAGQHSSSMLIVVDGEFEYYLSDEEDYSTDQSFEDTEDDDTEDGDY